MKIYSFLEIYQNAKLHSPFYRKLYENHGVNAQIEDLPLIDSEKFWQVNSPAQNQILTQHQADGIVFKSGGTSGNAKFSYFTKEEWKTYTEIFGAGMARGAIADGDIVANFFYAGDLYASFIFIMKSIEASNCQVIHLPLAGTTEPENILKVLNEFKANVWAGPPTSLMKLAEVVYKNGAHQPTKILYGGESFYPDQKAHLLSIFKSTKIQSVGYASVDGGHVGYADLTCGPGEHRVFSQSTIVEILDPDTLEPIHEINKKGKIYFTNLIRQLMPIIRYPVGDLGEWTEEVGMNPDRKFRILGRSEEGARVGPTTFYYDDIASFLAQHQTGLDSSGFQLFIRHFEQLDQLIIRVAPSSKATLSEDALLAAFEKERPVAKELARDKKLHRVAFQFVKPDQLISNPRTGKLKRIIDERF